MTSRILTVAGALALGSIAAPGCSGGAAESGSGGGNTSFGGAQDIGQFRGILDDGGIPGADTLDANGFMNEHYIELPPAECGQPLCGQAMVSVGADWLTGDYQAVLQVALNTPIDPTTLERPPLDLVVVVNTSGSMAENDRIGYARQGLDLLVDQMQEGDRLALVRYSSGVQVLSGLGESTPAELHQMIAGLRADGSTNFYGGLETGFQIAEAARDPERQSRVILLSDGQPTAGDTNESSIVNMADGYIGEAIGLTTIGVGRDFNVGLMRGLAERGAGNFYFLEDASAIAEVFTDELDYFSWPLALGVSIEVEAGPSYNLGEVLGTRLWQTEGAVGKVQLPAVFLASRTSATPDPNGRRGGGSTLFIRLQPNSAGTSIDPDKVASIRLRYRDAQTGETIAQDIDVTSPTDPGVTPEEAWFSHQAMAKNYAAYNVFLGLRAAAEAAASDYDCALSVLDQIGAATRDWQTRYEDPDLDADLALIDQFSANLRAQGAFTAESDAPLAACGPNYDPGDRPPYGDDVYDGACSVGHGAGNGGSLLAIGLALLLAARRRRR